VIVHLIIESISLVELQINLVEVSFCHIHFNLFILLSFVFISLLSANIK
jgi:hypothetical protein